MLLVIPPVPPAALECTASVLTARHSARPATAHVLAWSEGDPAPRRPRVHFLGDTGFRTAVVDITRGAVETAGPAAGQPMLLFEAFTGAMRGALKHLEMLAGLARRGLMPGEVFCFPLTAGN